MHGTDSFHLSQSSKSKSKMRKEKIIYHLHAVLCHSGSLNQGHYFCFIRQYEEGL